MDISELFMVVRFDGGGAIRGLKDLDNKVKETDANAKKSGSSVAGSFGKMAVIGTAVAAVGTFAAALGAATDAASKDQAAHAKLATALTDMGQSIPQEQLDTAISSMDRFGHTGDDTQVALAKMVEAGIPAQKAIADLGTTADLAANQHISLESAASMMAQAANGRLSPAMKQLGVRLKKGETGAAAFNDIVGQLSPRLSGQATAASQTFGGALDSLKATFTDSILVPLGNKVLPMLTSLANWFQAHEGEISGALTTAFNVLGIAIGVVGSVLGVLADHFNIIGPILAGVIGGFVAWKTAMLVQSLIEGISTAVATFGAIMGGEVTASEAAAAAGADGFALSSVAAGAAAVASGIAAAAAFLLPLAPFILIGAAVVGLVALIVTHWNQVKAITATVFNAIKSVITTVFGAIKSVISAAVGVIGKVIGTVLTIITAPFKAAFAIVSGLISDLVAGFQSAANTIGSIFQTIASAIGAVVNGIASTVGSIISGIVSTVKGIIDVPIGIINDIIGIIDGIQIHVPSWVPGIGGDGWDGLGIPKIPTLAAGATATRPTLAIFGEAGKEHAVPDLDMSNLLSRAAQAGANAKGGGGDTHVTINNPHSNVDVMAALESDRRLNQLAARGIVPGPHAPMAIPA